MKRSTLTKLVLATTIALPTYSTLPSTTFAASYVLKGGKLVYKTNTKKVVAGYAIYKSKLYKSGVLYTGLRNSVYYKKGVKGTAVYKSKLYKSGKLFTGLYNSKYYKNGVKATGTYNSKFYKSGSLFTGIYNKVYYVKGVKTTGVYKNFFYYKGVLHTGYYSGLYYKAGKPYTGLGGSSGKVYFKNGAYGSGFYNSRYYKNGLYFTGVENGVVYKSGKRLTGIYEEDGLYYQNGQLGTGVYKTMYYDDGLPGTGIYNNRYYKNGVRTTGLYKGVMYKNGVPFSGKIDDVYYYQGVPFSGTTSYGYRYKNGLRIDGQYKDEKGIYREYTGGKVEDGLKKGKLYTNGLIVTGYRVYQGKLYKSGDLNVGLVKFEGDGKYYHNEKLAQGYVLDEEVIRYFENGEIVIQTIKVKKFEMVNSQTLQIQLTAGVANFARNSVKISFAKDNSPMAFIDKDIKIENGQSKITIPFMEDLAYGTYIIEIPNVLSTEFIYTEQNIVITTP